MAAEKILDFYYFIFPYLLTSLLTAIFTMAAMGYQFAEIIPLGIW